jgi:high-affinity iron transporter
MHWLRFGGHVPWSTSGTISEDSSFGDVLHSLLGYADRPTVLQAIVWFTYLVVSTIPFVRLGKRGRPRQTLDSQPVLHANDGRLPST